VALSADGNTAIVGGGGAGAAWVFTRSGGVWTQQGSDLVGGSSVALSADGNTAIVGVAVYTRSGAVWTQQAGNLVAGSSVALSADGNTAIVGVANNSGAGGAWVYARSGGVWTQQGNGLVGTDAVGYSVQQGTSVALSADGGTAILGGPRDDVAGAAWVFTRSGGVWTQQGNKLVGTGGSYIALQGYSVALSADGNTAIVGGPEDGTSVGAAWVFTRSSGVWTQQGSKLVGTGANGALQGWSVALSGDGNTAIVGDNDVGGAGRRGCSRDQAALGPSRAANWLVLVRCRMQNRAGRWRCRLTLARP